MPDAVALGPDSVAWELHAAPAMLTAGLRALLLQLWHPSIASAVAAHSEVARDPWQRYQATVGFVTSVTYGDDEEALEAVRRVRSAHGPVRGIDTRGTPYTASDPDLVAYVHATLVDSALSAADVYGPRLSPARTRPLRVGDGARREVARAEGSAARCRGRRARRHHRRTTRSATPVPGRDLAWLLAIPPMPIWMRPAYGVLFASAVDLLPRQCAVDLGLLPVWGVARPAVRGIDRNVCSRRRTSPSAGAPLAGARRRVARRSFAAS